MIKLKKMTFLALAFVLLVAGTCGGNPASGTGVPNCKWDDTNNIVFYNLALKFPSEISNYHKNLIPSNNIETSLINILETDGDIPNSSSKSYVFYKATADGTRCKGFKQNKFSKGDPNVTGNSVKIPYVSNTVFEGEVKVNIRSDIFNNYVGGGAYYYVIWQTVGNNPNGGINGNIIGVKTTTNSYNIYSDVIFKDGNITTISL